MWRRLLFVSALVAFLLLIASCPISCTFSNRQEISKAQLLSDEVLLIAYDSCVGETNNVLPQEWLGKLPVQEIELTVVRGVIDRENTKRAKAGKSLVPNTDPWGSEWRLTLVRKINANKGSDSNFEGTVYSFGPNRRNDCMQGDDIVSHHMQFSFERNEAQTNELSTSN